MPNILKGDGTTEAFEPTKLVDSMLRSGTDRSLAEEVAKDVSRSVRDGMTTTEIYKKAFKLLREEEHVTAARYSMRRAILELGPTGFPFEDYVSAVLHAKGYETRTRVMLQGKCAEHEVDIVLKKDGKTFGAELKFHNTPGFKTDIKTALYVRARFTDIESHAHLKGELCAVDGGWLITNTKFTENAINYAACAGIKLIGWGYPDKGNLSDMIAETGVYPITVMTSLSSVEKAKLLTSGVALCHTLISDPSALPNVGITGKKQETVIKESLALCKV